MHFDDSPSEAAFRLEVRAWLDSHARRRTRAGEHLFTLRGSESEYVERARRWQAAKADAGYGALQWPREYGGAGRSPLEAYIFGEEEARYEVPHGVLDVGLGMCGPVLLRYADEETKRRLLPPMVRGEEIWCQLFSEPGAGSDLAGISTRARRDGDSWVVDGQKVWTSFAHYSRRAILLARHDPDLPKHAGLTFFWLDLASAGVAVRPIRQMSGAAGFNQVFLDGVRVPDSQRLGAVGEGWQVAMATLGNERLAVGGVGPPDFGEIFALARRAALDGEAAVHSEAVRSRLADWYVEAEGLRLTRARTLTRLGRGETPGPEASIERLVAATKQHEISSFGADLREQAGILLQLEGCDDHGLFQAGYLSSPGRRIAGGSSEILRNVIAERVLRLPGEPRVDRDRPFSETARG